MHTLFFVTGASGSGKTTTVEYIEKNLLGNMDIFYFDSVGVPSKEEMTKIHGSGESRQKNTTNDRVKKIKENYLTIRPSLLDGQMRIAFIEEACRNNNVTNFHIILVDCNEEERARRLIGRGHPHHVNEQMMNRARYLKDEAIKGHYTIIDNTNISLEETAQQILQVIDKYSN